MRFDFEAYEKVFPEVKEASPIESAVDTFTPTASEKAMDNKPGAEELNADPTPKPETKSEVIVTTEEIGEKTPEGENNG